MALTIGYRFESYGVSTLESCLKSVWPDMRAWIAGLTIRHAALPLQGCVAGLTLALIVLIPADTRLLLLGAGLCLVGVGGLITHGARRWNDFCRHVARQAFYAFPTDALSRRA